MTRFLSPRELAQEVLTRLRGSTGPKQRMATHLSTSTTQVDRLLSGSSDPKWSSIQQLAAALGKLEDQEYSVQVVLVPTKERR